MHKQFIYTVPCKKTGLFGVFHTKYIHTTRVENHLKVMLNPPIFSQMLVLMWEAYQWVLVPKFSMVFELQAFKFKSTKKVSFSKEKLMLKIWQLKSPEPLEILQPKLMEKLPTLMQAIEEKLGNFT